MHRYLKLDKLFHYSSTPPSFSDLSSLHDNFCKSHKNNIFVITTQNYLENSLRHTSSRPPVAAIPPPLCTNFTPFFRQSHKKRKPNRGSNNMRAERATKPQPNHNGIATVTAIKRQQQPQSHRNRNLTATVTAGKPQQQSQQIRY